MTARPADIPPFNVMGIEWRCYAVTDPDGDQRYEWRTPAGRCAAGRNVGASTWWARYDGEIVGRDFARTKDQHGKEHSPGQNAMAAAIRHTQRRAA